MNWFIQVVIALVLGRGAVVGRFLGDGLGATAQAGPHNRCRHAELHSRRRRCATSRGRRARCVVEAQQKIETARGDAESVRIAAEAQSQANRLLAESLTPEVIQFQALQKLADNVQIALLPAGQGIIIDPTTLLGQQQPAPP